MAARVRTLKGIIKAMESLERSCKEYYAVGNSDMVRFYKQKLRDAKYIKSLIENDIEDDRYRARCRESQNKETR